MKKTVAMVLAAFVLAGLAACGGSKKSETFDLALVTDLGTIDDKSFNQGAW